MTTMFHDPAFRERWQQMKLEDPDITLQDFILIINGQEPENRLHAESREEASKRRKLERRAERSDLNRSNDALILSMMARRKANPLPKKREGKFISFKIADLGNSYTNSDNRVICNSLTNISLC